MVLSIFSQKLKFQKLKEVYQQVVHQDPLEWVLQWTLLLLILFVDTPWDTRLAVVSWCLCGFVYRPWRFNAWYWWGLAGVLFGFNFFHWAFSDNHRHLMAYWCLAIGCSLKLSQPIQALALNARLLIGLLFLFATLWKASSATYMDGSMFHFLLLADTRFPEVSSAFGLTSAMWNSNLEAQQQIHQMPELIRFQSTPLMEPLAQFLTWWTLLIEALVALCFLWPDRQPMNRWRHSVLFAFIITTYPIAGISGFAWLLLVMGRIQCRPGLKKTHLGYILLLLLTFLFWDGYLKRYWVGM